MVRRCHWFIIRLQIIKTSCKIKLVVPYTCISISKDMCNLHNFERSGKPWNGSTCDRPCCLWHTLSELKLQSKRLSPVYISLRIREHHVVYSKRGGERSNRRESLRDFYLRINNLLKCLVKTESRCYFCFFGLTRKVAISGWLHVPLVGGGITLISITNVGAKPDDDGVISVNSEFSGERTEGGASKDRREGWAGRRWRGGGRGWR